MPTEVDTCRLDVPRPFTEPDRRTTRSASRSALRQGGSSSPAGPLRRRRDGGGFRPARLLRDRPLAWSKRGLVPAFHLRHGQGAQSVSAPTSSATPSSFKELLRAVVAWLRQRSSLLNRTHGWSSANELIVRAIQGVQGKSFSPRRSYRYRHMRWRACCSRRRCSLTPPHAPTALTTLETRSQPRCPARLAIFKAPADARSEPSTPRRSSGESPHGPRLPRSIGESIIAMGHGLDGPIRSPNSQRQRRAGLPTHGLARPRPHAGRRAHAALPLADLRPAPSSGRSQNSYAQATEDAGRSPRFAWLTFSLAALALALEDLSLRGTLDQRTTR